MTMPSCLDRISSISFCLKQFPVGLLGVGIMRTPLLSSPLPTMASTSSWKSSVSSTSRIFPDARSVK